MLGKCCTGRGIDLILTFFASRSFEDRAGVNEGLTIVDVLTQQACLRRRQADEGMQTSDHNHLWGVVFRGTARAYTVRPMF